MKGQERPLDIPQSSTGTRAVPRTTIPLFGSPIIASDSAPTDARTASFGAANFSSKGVVEIDASWTTKLWNVRTGRRLFMFNFDSSVRGC